MSTKWISICFNCNRFDFVKVELICCKRMHLYLDGNLYFATQSFFDYFK